MYNTTNCIVSMLTLYWASEMATVKRWLCVCVCVRTNDANATHGKSRSDAGSISRIGKIHMLTCSNICSPLQAMGSLDIQQCTFTHNHMVFFIMSLMSLCVCGCMCVCGILFLFWFKHDMRLRFAFAHLNHGWHGKWEKENCRNRKTIESIGIEKWTCSIWYTICWMLSCHYVFFFFFLRLLPFEVCLSAGRCVLENDLYSTEYTVPI